jgi:inosose dehydratase
VPTEPHSLIVGLATYSLRTSPIEAAIGLLQRCGVKSVAVFNAHVPIRTGTPDECVAAAKKFRDAGIALASTGVAELSGDETVMRRLFENARATGVPTMACTFVTAPDRATLRVVENFAREYDIRVAIHNHGPEDPLFPAPREYGG